MLILRNCHTFFFQRNLRGPLQTLVRHYLLSDQQENLQHDDKELRLAAQRRSPTGETTKCWGQVRNTDQKDYIFLPHIILISYSRIHREINYSNM